MDLVISTEIRVLGPFDVRVGDRPLRVGPGKPSLLLAMLALHANRVVSTDRLVDALWGDDPPDDAHRTVQKYVYRLRSALTQEGDPADSGSLRVETRAAGYVLVAPDGGLDADLFVSIVGEARRIRAEDPTAAIALLDDALALWRGAAWIEFADLEPFRTDAARLDEHRVAAIEDRTDLGLILGRHRELIPELEQTIATYPLRERPRAQLMLALHRSGRQVEALRAFRDFREYLGEEVGLEPSEGLQRLEDDIVQQKSDLDLAPTAAGRPTGALETRDQRTPRPPLPARLEAASRGRVVGRAIELGWFDVLWSRGLAGKRQTALVFGPRGVGKTALASEFARRVHAAGALVVYASGHRSRDDAARLVGESTGSACTDTLVILDDVDATEAGWDDVGPATLVVGLTGRAVRIGETGSTHARELGGLPREDVEVLLTQFSGAADPALVDAVLAETGGIPALVVEFAQRLHEREVGVRLERALERAAGAGDDLRAAEAQIAVEARGRIRRDFDRSSERLAASGACPYKGLAAFGAADAGIFCGRERLVGTLVARLAVNRFLAVVGASGSGKSSLVQAGLLPTLALGALPGSAGWTSVIVTPGADPLGTLGDALAREARLPTADVARRLTEPDGLLELAAEVVDTADGGRLLLVVDQFEELFTSGASAETRDAYASALLDSVTNASGAVSVVIVLRADYYEACSAHAELSRRLERDQVLVGAMTTADLQDAITQPAASAGLDVDDALVAWICADAGSEPGALPLVSTALLETWVRREGRALTLAGYLDAGGVHGALASLAERVYERLGQRDQQVARSILLRLAHVTDANDDVRRRAPRSEIDAIAGAGSVLAMLVGARLVTADHATVEVAHEAILREWPRLRAWLEEDRDGRRLHRRLVNDASAWEREGRDAADLYRGARLDSVHEWSAAQSEPLNPVEAEFVSASTAAHEDALQVARSSARRSRRMARVLAGLCAVALVAGAVSVAQWRGATHSTSRAHRAVLTGELARAGSLARNLPASNADLALLLGVEVHRLRPDLETEGALETALTHVPPALEQTITFPAPTFFPALSNDGSTLAAPGSDGKIRFIDVRTGRVRRVLQAHHDSLVAVFSNDGSQLVVGSTDGTVSFWDVATGRPAGASITAPGKIVYGYEGDSASAFTVSDRGEVDLWDRSDPQHPRRVGAPFRFPLSGGPGVAIPSRDGRLLAAGGFGPNGAASTRVWNLATHRLLRIVPGTADAFLANDLLVLTDGPQVVFRDARTGLETAPPLTGTADVATEGVTISADGRFIATLDASNQVRVYDLRTRRPVGAPLATDGSPGAFLPDGRLMTTDSLHAQLWRVGATLGPLGTKLSGHNTLAVGEFLRGGTQIATQGIYDPKVLLFDADTGAPARPLANAGAGIQDVSRDGRLETTGLPNESVVLRQASNGRALATLATLDPRRGDAWSQFAPDGKLVAIVHTGASDQSVLVLSVVNPRSPRIVQRIVAPGRVPPGGMGWLIAGFSHDGHELAVIDKPGNRVTLFDVATGHERWTHVFGGTVWQAVFDPSDTTLAVTERGLNSSDLTLWDVRRGVQTREQAIPNLWGAAFLQGGHLIATTEDVGTSGGAQLWDATTLAPVGAPILVPSTELWLDDASPLGDRLATGTDHGFVAVWDVAVADWQASACQIAGRDLTRHEWHEYLPDFAYGTTCPEWSAAD